MQKKKSPKRGKGDGESSDSAAKRPRMDEAGQGAAPPLGVPAEEADEKQGYAGKEWPTPGSAAPTDRARAARA